MACSDGQQGRWLEVRQEVARDGQQAIDGAPVEPDVPLVEPDAQAEWDVQQDGLEPDVQAEAIAPSDGAERDEWRESIAPLNCAGRAARRARFGVELLRWGEPDWEWERRSPSDEPESLPDGSEED